MDIQEREKDFQIKVNREISFSYELRKEFIDYWTEQSSRGKMRFEFEKTWDLKRRLARWANTGKIGQIAYAKNGASKQPENEFKSGIKEVQELDTILSIYKLHPTSIRFDEFGRYFDFLKGEKLIKKLTQPQIDSIRQSYPDDNYKCRCACVQLTIQGYVDSGFTFAKVFELRQKLA